MNEILLESQWLQGRESAPEAADEGADPDRGACQAHALSGGKRRGG